MMMIFSVLFFLSHAFATDGYSIAAGANQDITEFSTCKHVVNGKSKSIFVPTKFTTEWTSFYTNPPSSVTVTGCVVHLPPGPGYVVMTSARFNGNLGNLAGASATCLSSLNTDTWKNKASAGTLTANRVRAFLCRAAGTCNGAALPSQQYIFAMGGDVASGGASFTTDSSGFGPGDSANWIGATYFGGDYNYWTGHAANTATSFNQTGVASQCSNWGSSLNTVTGVMGSSSNTGSARWNNGTTSCDTTEHLLCIVDPYETPPQFTGVSASGTTGTTHSLSRPASYAAGDLDFLIVIGPTGFTGITSGPTGWSRIAQAGPSPTNGYYIDVWYKTLTASEPANYVFNLATTVATVRINTTLPGVNGITIGASGGQANATSTNVTGPSVTTASTHARVVYISATTGFLSTAPSGFTTISSNNPGVAYAIAQEMKAATGATGALVGTAASTDSAVVSFVVERP